MLLLSGPNLSAATLSAATLAAVLALTFAASPTTASAQTLARPGWAGSGLTANAWWRHAVVYAVDLHARGVNATGAHATGSTSPDTAPSGLKAVAAGMDAMQALGVDAVLLRGLQSGADAAIDPAAGTMDDFDEVLLQASRHNLRVLVELAPRTSTEDLSGVARFWLSRGVAGFRLLPAGDSKAQMRQLRTIAKTYVGERVMIGDAALSNVAAPAATPAPTPADVPAEVAVAVGQGQHRRHSAHPANDLSQASAHEVPVRVGDGPQLLLDASIAVAPLNVAAIRIALEKNDVLSRSGTGVPMLATAEGAGGGPESGKVVATLLLSTRGGAMIRAGQEGAGDAPEAASLSAWYKRMSVLQHSNATIRTGVNATLNHDEQKVVAWVRRPQVVSYHSPAVVFLCNMTDKSVTLSLRTDMAALHLKGSFLRTLVRSDQGMGAMSLDAVTVAPYGVYVGELLY